MEFVHFELGDIDPGTQAGEVTDLGQFGTLRNVGAQFVADSGSQDHTVKVWDVGTGQERATLKGHADPVTSVALSGDGKTLASGSVDRTVKVWDVGTGQERATLKGHTDPVSSVALSGDGKTLVSGSEDGTVKLWEVVLPHENPPPAGKSKP